MSGSFSERGSLLLVFLIFLTLLTKDRYHPTSGYELVIGGLQLGAKVVEFRFEEIVLSILLLNSFHGSGSKTDETMRVTIPLSRISRGRLGPSFLRGCYCCEAPPSIGTRRG